MQRWFSLVLEIKDHNCRIQSVQQLQSEAHTTVVPTSSERGLDTRLAHKTHCQNGMGGAGLARALVPELQHGAAGNASCDRCCALSEPIGAVHQLIQICCLDDFHEPLRK